MKRATKLPDGCPEAFYLPPRKTGMDETVQRGVSDVLSFEGIPSDELNRVIVDASAQTDKSQNVVMVVVDPWSVPPKDNEEADLESNYVPDETTRVSKARARDLMKGHSKESRHMLSRPSAPVEVCAFPVNVGIRASSMSDDARKRTEDINNAVYDKYDEMKRLKDTLDNESDLPKEKRDELFKKLKELSQEMNDANYNVEYASVFEETLGGMDVEQTGVVMDREFDHERQVLSNIGHVYLEESKTFMREYRRLLGPEYGRKFLDAMRTPAYQAFILVYNTESHRSWLNWIVASDGIREKDESHRIARSHMYTVEKNRREAASTAAKSAGRFGDDGNHPKRLVVPFFLPKSQIAHFLVDVSTKRFAVVQPASLADEKPEVK